MFLDSIVSHNHNLNFIDGLAYYFVFNFIFGHLGHLLAFFVGRYLLRHFFTALAAESTYFKGVNRVCRLHGSYLTFLLRCSSVLPYYLISYMLSVTNSKYLLTVDLLFIVRLRDYLLGNNGFLFPSLIYMYLGASAKEVFALLSSYDSAIKPDPEAHRLKVIMFSIGAFIMVGVIVLIGWLTKREINKMIEERVD
jgi:uncharacterized membrane protein YdjX (TVP38/TMEM64 family)